MVKEYRYKPPFENLFWGLILLVLSFIFGSVILSVDTFIAIITGFLCVLFFGFGIGLIIIFVRKFNLGPLRVGKNYIEIPGRWKSPIKLKFNDIKNIGEFETYDQVIEIVTKEKRYYLIERKWMKKMTFFL